MSHSSSNADPIAALADEFVERYQRGENPTIDEYLESYPDHAERIRRLFPTLIMVEELAPEDDSVPFGGESSATVPAIDRIRDYRIIRELGRGGMGVVYEAEQESLGRRVALKVLRGEISSSAVERFRLEARVAARLRHTNIVPVYEVGEEDGMWFYAMQQIPGLGLDKVLDELNRFERTTDEQLALESPTEATTVAHDMLSGRHSSVFAERQNRARAAADRQSTPVPDSSSVCLPGQSDLSDAHSNRSQYFSSVACIGLQVARALAYAHEEGIIHRDIKPSNLLLDGDGNIWLSDFGLAKVANDGPTRTANIVGTLRYMSPERFKGWADPRSDVYSLGMTLYELLVLRPAFRTDDRVELIRLASETEPERPRLLDRRIPRDLETIVLKAITKEPGHRYQSADELAHDLDCFLNDKPIRARQVSQSERLLRWCRRNRLVACLLLLLIGGFANALIMWSRASAQEKLAQENYVQALKSTNRVFQLFTQDQQLDDPALRPLRRRLLKYSLISYQTFLKRYKDDPTLQSELVDAHRAVGEIDFVADDFEGSTRAYRKALALLDKLEPTRESNAKIAATLSDLGTVKTQLVENAESLRLFTDALDRLNKYAVHEPLETELLVRAKVHQGLTIYHSTEGKFKKAAEEIKKAIADYQLLISERDNGTSYSKQLGYAKYLLGSILLESGDYNGAERALNDSYELFDLLPRATPEPPRSATVDRLRADLCLRTGQLERAQHYGRKAIAAFTRLVALDPEYHDHRRNLARSHQLLGMAHAHRLEYSEAASHYKSAVAHEDQLLKPGTPAPARHASIHTLLGELFAAQGLVEKAKLHLKKMVELAASTTPGDFVATRNVASAFSQLAGLEPALESAEPLYLRAIRLRSRIVEISPEIPEYGAELAGTYCNLANRYLANDKTSQAVATYERAAAIMKGLDDSRIPLSRRRNRALIYQNLANACLQAKQPEKARLAQQEAVTAREKLARDFPGVPMIQHDLANSYFYLATRGSNSEKHYRRAIEIWRPLVGKYPPLDTSLGGACCNLAMLLCPTVTPASKNFTESIELLDFAIVTLEAVREQNPNFEPASQFLWNTLFTAAQFHGNAGSLRDDRQHGEQEIARSLELLQRARDHGLMGESQLKLVRRTFAKFKSRPRWNEFIDWN